MTKLSLLCTISISILLLPLSAGAQQLTRFDASEAGAQEQNLPRAVQQVESDVERAARRFRVGVQGGVGLDPEIIDVGVHASFGPLFTPRLQFRPVVELGLGEVTTIFGINLDLLYSFDAAVGEDGWAPYVGGGPNFGMSHRGFATEDEDNVDVDGVEIDRPGRFDFSDTDFNGGMNFIVGMRRPNGVFFEMKATAWGVTNVRLLAGFSF